MLEVVDGSGVSGSLSFAANGTLKIDDATLPTAVISGFAGGDVIDLAGVSFGSGDTVQLQAGNVLNVVANGNSYQLQLDAAQDFSHASFQLSSDGTGGTSIAMTDNLNFSGSGSTLSIGGTSMPRDVISGFAVGDSLDLTGVGFANGGSIQLEPGNQLQLVANGITYDLQLDPTQDYSNVSFRLASDGHGGTDIDMEHRLSINLTYDSSVSSAPASFNAALNQMIALYESDFTNAATINIDVGYGEINGQALNPNALGESSSYLDPYVTYAQLPAARWRGRSFPAASLRSAVAARPAT